MTAIVAMTPSRVIGRGASIPWKLPEDLRWFKRVTLGHPVLMGRKTFCTLPRPLPGRRNLVVSRLATFAGVEMVRDLGSFDPRPDDPEVFVIGGAEVYAALLPRCRSLLITHVRTDHTGDTYFPAHEHLFRPAELLHETPEFTTVRYERKEGGEVETGNAMLHPEGERPQQGSAAHAPSRRHAPPGALEDKLPYRTEPLPDASQARHVLRPGGDVKKRATTAIERSSRLGLGRLTVARR